jgi:chromosome segregation ATPase
MNARRILVNACTICLLATAVLLSQSALSGSASATPGDAPSKGDNLKQRVKILELLQEDDDKEFLLVDASLTDLNARVEANEERCARTSKRLVETDKRAGKMGWRITENRTGAREIRASIKQLKADLRANGIKLSDKAFPVPFA